jgi:hypothetical protein
MPRIDFFNFFRWWLAVIVTIYATAVTLQWFYGWIIYLSGREKYVSILRRYVIVQGLRLRFRSFYGDVVICLLLCVACGLLWRAHNIVHQIHETLPNYGRNVQSR